MNTLGLWLMWCSLPATLFALVGIGIYFLTRRAGPAIGALTVLTTLLVLSGVSLLALSPWPHWWTLKIPASPSPAQVATVVTPTASAPSVDAARVPDEIVPTDIPDVAAEPRPTIAEPAWQPWLEELLPARAQLADSASTWHWPAIVGLVFVAGVCLALLRFVLGLWMVQRYRASSQAITSPAILEQRRQIAAALGISRPIELRQSRELGSPVTIDWWRPLVLLPAGWAAWSDEERRVVLAHEMAHIARRDYLTWLLAQLSLTLHFYHPLVHWLVRRLRLEQELAADILGAELSGGRELYLVTLTQMVLRQDSRTVGWFARPFLPSHGTFLKRIELLSENKSLRPGAWSRGTAITLVVALVLLGLAIAGVRMPSGEPVVVAQAGERSNAKVDEGAAVEAKPVAKTKGAEKPLTLAELQTTVIDQIRSIRSLHISYTTTQPESFGGKSQDHVWAEQGFKLLKRDVPGKNRPGYATSFDGKRTYQLAYEGDQPAGTNIREEFGRDLYSVNSSLVGRLHTLDHRESIINAIRSPTAKLVDAVKGAPGPTIEVTNYTHEAGGKYGLNVKLVLDRAHGYLPSSITYHEVANPSWRFAYEVDEFVKVRDGATGKDRWFPSRGRYLQRTEKTGEQVFTTVFHKVTINEPLPDEMFVLYVDSPTVAPGQEQQALAEFEKAYQLEPDQIVKRVPRPYLPGRIPYIKKWWASAFAQSPYETTGTFLPMVYPVQDGKLGAPGFSFVSSIGQNSVPASDLLNGVGAELNLRSRKIEDPDKLLEKKMEGDIVIRTDVPAEKVVAAFGQLLKRECGVPVALELRETERTVVMISGRIKPPFEWKPETVLEIAARPLPEKDDAEMGSFYKFMQAVGESMQPKLTVLSTIENYPYTKDTVSWRRSARVSSGDKAQDEKENRALLERLEQQTGLKFTLQPHKFQIIYVKRSE